MIDSRSLDELTPETKLAALRHLALCAENGIQAIVTSTYRDAEAQAALYAIGRTVAGAGVRPTKPFGVPVTNAKPGESYHNYRVAYDVAIVQYGKLVWDNTPAGLILWNRVGELGTLAGLSWAGKWKTFKELAHFQLPGANIKRLREAASGHS